MAPLFILFCFLMFHSGHSFQTGMAFFPVNVDLDSPEAIQSLQNLKETTDAQWVCVIVTWYQDTINSTFIYPVPGRSPTMSQLTSFVNNATSMGIKVFLKPHVDVLDGTWRAWIGTYFTDSDWNVWFYSYKAFYLNFALLAQQLGIAQYSVGTEMITASVHSSEFIDLVSQVRTYFTGVVTYSANWGTKLQSVLPNIKIDMSPYPTYLKGEINDITWLNVLDIIGVDAYYYLTSNPNPSLNDLLIAWDPIVAQLNNVSQYWNKSIIFTEVGYRSIEGAAIHPGWWNTSAAVNLTQQAICYEAVFQSFMNKPWWEGTHWWAWQANPNAGGANDTDFTPQNKPLTLAVLTKYYSILDSAWR